MGSKGISTNMSKETSRGTSRKHIHQLTLVHLLPSPNSVQLYNMLVSSVPVCHCFTFPPKWICTHQSFPLLRQPSLCHCGEVKAKHINACCSLFHCASFPPSNFSQSKNSITSAGKQVLSPLDVFFGGHSGTISYRKQTFCSQVWSTISCP